MPVYKDKRNNKWYAFFNYTDALGQHKQYHSRYFDTKAEASDELARITLEYKNPTQTKRITFDQIHREYVEEQKKIVKPITAAHYDPLYEHIKPFIGKMYVEKLTVPQYKAIKKELDNLVIKEKEVDGRTKKYYLSTTRKNRLHKYVKTLCRFAKKYYNIDCEVPDIVGGFYDPAAIEEDTIKVISEEEFNRFIECFNSDLLYKTLFTTLFYQGCRIGEALALTWKDINFNTGKMRINKTYTARIGRGYKEQDWYITSPKTKASNRTIPLDKTVAEGLKSLQEWYRLFEGYKDSWFVFGGPRPMSETAITNRKDAALKECGISRITIHQFRHSCASYLFSHGVKPTAVQAFLGHSKLSTTMNIYTHLYPEELDNIFSFKE